MIASSQSGGTPAEVYTLKLGYRVPEGLQVPQVRVNDENGAPLVLGGVPVIMALAPCAPGSCEVDLTYPAPAGDRWVQFESVNPIPPSGVDGQIDMYIEVEYGLPLPLVQGAVEQACGALGLEGELVAAWHSDDRDTRYGINVVDFFGEMIVDPSAKDAPALSLTALIVLVVAIGAAARLSGRVVRG